MTISLEEMKKGLPEGRRVKIRARVLELEAERQVFLKTRRAFDLACKQLAEEQGVEVHSIRRDRDHADLFLGTLKNFVKATGGELRLLVEYPGMPTIEIESLAWLDELDSEFPSPKGERK